MKYDMVKLVNSFPVIRDRIGDKFTRWDATYIASHDGLKTYYDQLSTSGKYAIDFALQVWNQNEDWTELGFRNFNVVLAFGAWDPGQRKAFRAWADDPWFP
jgi:hypothetical protein